MVEKRGREWARKRKRSENQKCAHALSWELEMRCAASLNKDILLPVIIRTAAATATRKKRVEPATFVKMQILNI